MGQEEWKEVKDGCSTIVLWGSGSLYCSETGAATVFKVYLKCFNWTYIYTTKHYTIFSVNRIQQKSSAYIQV